MDKLIRVGARGAGIISAVALSLMVFCTSADVIARLLLKRPIPGIFEGMGLLMAVVVFLALGYAELEHAHIRMDSFVERLPRGFQKAMLLLGYLLTAGILVVLVWYGGREALHSISIREYEMGLVEIPIYIFRPAVPLGAAMFLAVVLLHMYRLFRPEKQAESVKANAINPDGANGA